MDIRAIVMGVSFALMWSSAFTSARIIVLQAPPLTISSLRFLIAGTLAICIDLTFSEPLFRGRDRRNHTGRTPEYAGYFRGAGGDGRNFRGAGFARETLTIPGLL